MQKSRVKSFSCPGDAACSADLELKRQLTSVLTNVSQFVSEGFWKCLPWNDSEAAEWVYFGDCGLGNISPPAIVAGGRWRSFWLQSRAELQASL